MERKDFKCTVKECRQYLKSVNLDCKEICKGVMKREDALGDTVLSFERRSFPYIFRMWIPDTLKPTVNKYADIESSSKMHCACQCASPENSYITQNRTFYTCWKKDKKMTKVCKPEEWARKKAERKARKAARRLERERLAAETQSEPTVEETKI